MSHPDLSEKTTLSVSGQGCRTAKRILCLTIVFHPDLRRAGEIALLQEDDRTEWSLSRLEPEFFAPGSLKGTPLNDPYLSRKAIVISGSAEGFRLEAAPRGSLTVDGKSVDRASTIGQAAVDTGVVLCLGERIVLLLHRVEGVPRRGDGLGFIGASDALARLRTELIQVADRDVTVLIRGETGSGKELAARALHENSPRARGPFVALNLGAIPPSLMASELFGHVAGAFTGARDASPGAFLRARGGTLFLDEIAEMPLESQATLLRALEERFVVPVGGANQVRLDVRVVAATDADLDRLVAEGRFRAPLLHRLASYVIQVPPLRERRDDVGRLVAHFLAEEVAAIAAADLLHYRADRPSWLPANTVAAMAAYGWPGNVRELANCVRQIVIGSRGREQARVPPELERLWAETPAEAPDSSRPSTTKATQLSDEELARTLRECRWSATEAARVLGLSRTTLYALIEKSSSIRKVGDIDDDEILSCLQESDGSVARAAERLLVSERALRLRLKTLSRLRNSRAPKIAGEG